MHDSTDIIAFVEMLHRRLRDGDELSMSDAELAQAAAFAAIEGPWQRNLRAVLSAARRAGWSGTKH
jgi:hypothetical protein